ncbi:hypothetical protein LPJ70_003083 [Coemansia sp. RSA 2708]|nr:hypothetical protein LPJ70_003083 [Coemansia sp. RSA 2708]
MGMTRRRQAITERVPTTPRKVVVYTDNLMTSDSARSSAVNAPGKELEDSLGDTLNSALVISTSFRFDPELNMLEILDPRNPRNYIEHQSLSNCQVAGANNRPSPLYVKQAITCIKKQMGKVPIDELFVSFVDMNASAAANGGSAANSGVPPRKPKQERAFTDEQPPAERPNGSNLGRRDSRRSGDSGDSHESRDSGDSREHSSSTGAGSSNDSDAGDMSRYHKAWRMISRLRTDGEVAKIGICDVTKAQLSQLSELSGAAPDMVQIRVRDQADSSGQSADEDSAQHRLDDELRMFASQHGISIRTHSDNSTVLSNATFQALAADFKINERFPTTEVPPEGYRIDLMRPRWVVNYSLTIRNRGLVANRGYIVMASSDCVLDPNRVSRNVYAN